MKLTDVVSNIVLSKVCSIKPDKDSTESKNIELRVKFDQVTLQSVFDKAVSQTVISWQNGPGRKHFTTWKANQKVDVQFKAPAASTIPPEQVVAARLASMSKKEQDAYIADLIAQANNK